MYPAGGNQFQPLFRGQGLLSKVREAVCVEGKDCPGDSSGLEGSLSYGAGRIEVHLQIRLSLYFSDSLKKIL